MYRKIYGFTIIFSFLLSYLHAQNDFFRVGYWGIFPAPDTLKVSDTEKRLIENSNANTIQAWLLANDPHIDSVLKQLVGHCQYGWPVRHIEDVWFDYLDSLNTTNPDNAVYHVVGYNTDDYLLGREKQFYFYGKNANIVKTTYKNEFFECLNFYTNPSSGGFALRPGFGGYYIDHEKGIYGSDDYLKGLRFMGHHIKLKDPDHPVICSGNIKYINPNLPIMLNDSVDVIESQYYPFRRDVTYYSYDYEYQQDIIKNVIEQHWEKIKNLLAGSHIKWWAIIQACKYKNEPSNEYKRYPSGPELFLQAYLAVSRGAKGVLAFTYGDHRRDTSYVRYFRAALDIWNDQSDPRNIKIIKDIGSGRKYSIYDTLKLVFSELKKYGPTLMALEPEYGFLATGEYDTIPPACYIKSVSGDYIEAATFKKYNGQDYFMIINRICNTGNSGEIGIPAPPQTVTVYFHNLLANQCYTIKDLLNDRTYLFCSDNNGEFNFTYKLGPGRGRLFELSAYGDNWSGEFYISNDLKINGDKSIFIASGSTLKFHSGISLTLDGGSVLEANGNGQDSVLFTRNGTYNWYGIVVKNNSMLLLDRCKINNSSYGIYFDENSQGTVTNCSLNHHTRGFYIVRSAPQIEYCQITNCTEGMRLYHAYNPQSWITEDLNNIEITNCTSVGIIFIDSSPFIKNLTLKRNYRGSWHVSSSEPIWDHVQVDSSQIYAFMSSSSSCPDVYYNSNYHKGGFNSFTNSGDIGVQISISSYPYFGHYPLNNDGFNSILNNSSYEMKNSNDTYIYAQGNWWGNPNRPDSNELEGPVYWYPHLSSPPSENSKENSFSDVSDSINAAFPEDLETAYEEQIKGNFEKAAQLFKEYFTSKQDDKYAERACVEYTKSCDCYLSPEKMIDEFEKTVQQVKESDLQFLLNDAQITVMVRINQIKEALEKIDLTMQSALNSDEKNRLLLQKAFIYIYDLDQPEQGQKYLEEIVNNSSKGNDTYEIAFTELNYLEKNYNNTLAKKTLPEPVSSITVKNFTIRAYPNPFNNSITVSYQLPGPAITLSAIFDNCGKRVWSIQKTHESSGTFKFVWKGINNIGLPVSSGVYYLRIQLEKLNTNQKISEKYLKLILIK